MYRLANFELSDALNNLFQFLVDTNKIEDIENVDPDLLHITSDEVLAMIKNGVEGWEDMVPDSVERAIKTGKLFDYRPNDKTIKIQD